MYVCTTADQSWGRNESTSATPAARGGPIAAPSSSQRPRRLLKAACPRSSGPTLWATPPHLLLSLASARRSIARRSTCVEAGQPPGRLPGPCTLPAPPWRVGHRPRRRASAQVTPPRARCRLPQRVRMRMRVCVRACERAWARACAVVRTCVRAACMRACGRACSCARVRRSPVRSCSRRPRRHASGLHSSDASVSVGDAPEVWPKVTGASGASGAPLSETWAGHACLRPQAHGAHRARDQELRASPPDQWIVSPMGFPFSARIWPRYPPAALQWILRL